MSLRNVLKIKSVLGYIEANGLEVSNEVRSRIAHDLVVTIHEDIYDNVGDVELLELYQLDEYDAEYGAALAKLHGYTFDEAKMSSYDILRIYRPNQNLNTVNVLLNWRLYGLEELGFKFQPHVFSSPKMDEETYNHINIYSNSNNILGQMCSNFYGRTSKYPTDLGGFYTIEGLYHYLRMIDFMVSFRKIAWVDASAKLESEIPEVTRLRSCTGIEGIRLGRKLKSELYDHTTYRPGAFSKDAENVLIKAIAFKMTLSIGIMAKPLGVVLSKLLSKGFVLDHYYRMQSRIVRPPHYDYLPNLISRIVEVIDPNESSVAYLDLLKRLNLED